MSAFKFTKTSVEAIASPASGQLFYRDTILRGFGLRVGQQSKVFVVDGQVNRKTRRVTIGRADAIAVNEARKRAMTILSDMAAGKDPNAEKKRAAVEGITVAKAFEAFFAARTKLAPHTVELNTRTMSLYLRDWKKTAVVKITRQLVLKRHQKVAKENGEVTANNVMRHLRSVYNFTAAGFEEFPANPVTILTQARAWYPEKRRRGVVSAQNLPDWWAAVMLEPEYARDYLLIALFTGMRRAEVGGLRWDQIDLTDRSLHIPTTKNGDPLDLPLSDFLVSLLAKRKAAASASPWVWRCCTTLSAEDSHRESMRLDGVHEQAVTRPLPHHELAQLVSH